MDGKKITVPGGAAEYATREMWRSRELGQKFPIAERWVEKLMAELGQLAVLGVAGFLTENPLIPSDAQAEKIFMRLQKTRIPDTASVTIPEIIRNIKTIVIEWQKSAFLADSNPVVEKAKNAVTGSTLSRSEADEIIDYVNMCVPPGEKV